MALQTGIELQDNFSSVFYGIVNSVNLAVSAMFDMQQAMNADIDTAHLQGAQNEINQATAAVNQLSSALANMGTPHMPAAPTISEWRNQSNIQTFDNTGVQRLTNEMTSLNNISEEVFRNQQQIDNQALGMEILPPNASWDINATNERVVELAHRLENLQGQDISLLGDDGAEQVNGQFEALRANMNSIVNLQAQLNQAIQEGDVSGLNQGYNQLNNMIIQIEQQTRSAQQTMESLLHIEWTGQSNIEIFNNTGVQRLTNEMASLNDISAEVFRSQQQIDTQALNMEILPPNASRDINATSQRIMELSQRLQNLQGQDISLLGDDGTEQVNDQFEALRANMNSIVNLQAQLNQAIQNGDVSSLNQGYNQLNNMIVQVEQQARNAQQTLNNLTNIEWHSSGGIEVFTGSGVDRFRQEMQSASTMMQQLNTAQQSIQQTASNMHILPASAVQDINSIGIRIQEIRQRISQIEANPLNMGTDTANRQLEQLRSQLDRAVQEQSQLNSALSNMDVSAANSAYMRLSQTIGNTERYIRDNVDEQGRFNQEVQQGIAESNELVNMIKRVAAGYLSIRSVGKVINISDELIQATARIDLMNDGLQTTEELTNMIYASTQNARGSFSDMTSVVARFGNNAKDAFGSSEEVVAFANLIQKQMTIAGVSTDEASNVMIQLSQALGSGVLRGDELNSIFEQAPNLIQNIADYLQVPIGDIREMAKEGELSAGVVKAAIFSATDEINAQFESMPMTWGQNWQLMKNTAVMAFQPVLERISEIANSEGFQNFVNGIIEGMAVISNIVLNVFELVGDFGSFVADNWSIISPAIYGVIAALSIYATYLAITKGAEIASKAVKVIAMFASYAHAAATRTEASETARLTAAQYGLNTALLSSPLTWIIVMIIAIIAIIYTVIAIINKVANTTISATGVICGAIATAGAFIWNLIVGVVNAVIGIGIELYNLVAAFANFFANVFNDPVGAILNLFAGMFDFILGIVQAAAKLIDTVLGSNLAGAVEGFRNNFADAVSEIVGDQTIVMEKLNASDYQLNRVEYSDAWDAGYNFGEKIDDKISEFSLSDIFGKTDVPNPDDYAYVFDGSNTNEYLSNISDNTDDISDSLEISEENLKYLRDLAEQEAVNRFTTAEITIEQNNTNNIKSEMDLDGVISGMTDAVNEAISIATEGVH